MPMNAGTRTWQQDYLDRFYRTRPGWRHYQDEWFDLLKESLAPGGRILEIGAGPANDNSRFLAGLAGSLTGLDVDEAVLGNQHLDQAVRYDGSLFPLPGDSFSHVVSHWVNEHLADPALHVQEVFRVLEPGGIYAFRTPNRFHYKTRIALLLPEKWHAPLVRASRRLKPEVHEPYPAYYRINTRRRIRSTLRAAGFSVARLSCSESYPVYGMACRAAFLALMLYERIVNSSPCFEGLRHTIDCLAVKPAAPAPRAGS